MSARGAESFLHLVEDEEPAFARLIERLAMIAIEMPATFRSIWSAVMPCSVPATLKSMSP